MTAPHVETISPYKAVSKLYNALMTGLVLTLVTHKSPESARQFVFAHFRRQHLEKFLVGLKKLGLDALPDAVACAQYHYFSNALGGVKTQYIYETDRKAWVRYPPPRWIWQGTAICAVPRAVNEAMLHGWHGHNGVSLKNPRLGFVCTGQTVEGDPGLEGYYLEYDRDLGPDERVRFAPNERAPKFDAASAPRLDSINWPRDRLLKVERSYAMEYVRSMVPVMLELFGEDDTKKLLGRAARLGGLQFYEECFSLAGGSGEGAKDFALWLTTMGKAQGETIETTNDGETWTVRQTGWKLMAGVSLSSTVGFDAWNALWSGALAAHNRDLVLVTDHIGHDTVWQIKG